MSPFFEAFLDGFTGGSFFFEAKHPGIPDRLFVAEEELASVEEPESEKWIATYRKGHL